MKFNLFFGPHYNSQKGVSILFAVLILSVVLSIALGTSNLIVRQLKVMRGVSNSVIAFYAADCGIEKVLLAESPSDISETLLNGAEYEVFVNASTTEGCDALNYCIKSIGSYKNTKRAIEIRY